MHNRRWVKIVPYAAGILIVALAVWLVLYLKNSVQSNEPPKKQIQQVTIITPPPPPPPPPEIKEPEVKDEVVEETPDEPEPAEDVAEADPGEDPAIGEGTESGLQLGSKGKVGFGGPGRGGYGSTIKAEINKAILRDKYLRTLEYEAIVTLWIEDDGHFIKFDIELLKGSQAAAEELERFLTGMAGIDKSKPLEETANRFRLKISSVI